MSEKEMIETVFKAPPGTGGIIMAASIATLRVIYEDDGSCWWRFSKRLVFEGVVCASLGWAAGSTLAALGYGMHWYLICGILVGFFGTESVRQLVTKILNKKTGG